MMQLGLFDKEDRLEKLSKLGDSLVRLNKAIAGITNLVYNICQYEFLCQQSFVAG